jgi:serine/threonine-protein kinase
MLQENTVVADRFRLIRLIGRGGMGSVWQAFDTRLEIACALKFIEGELAHVAEAHARFEREAKAAAALRSPHVVEIKDHGVWEGRPYIAMELLEGEDLGKALTKAGGMLPPAQVGPIVQQVCRALTKAHQAGIVHRDLKPDNIFLVNDDDRQLVKILDFGVAKQTSQTIDGSNTKTGAMLGTPYYMSPEQAQGIKSVDARSDLWSLAVIVYQCITGRLPFESEALGDLLVKIIVSPIPVPSQVAQVPLGFDVWWAKAADRNPDNRFATAKEFANTLALALGGSSITESSPALSQLRGTAVMNQGSGVGHSPFASTPNPYSAAAPAPDTRTGGFHATPHPGNPTPPGMVMSPQTYASNVALPSNPATFSGVEPPATVPKKGPPVSIIAGLVALALVGIGSAGIAVARRASATSTHPPASATAPASVSVVTAPSESAPSAKAATPEVPASATAQPEPVPSATPSATAVAHATAKPATTGGSKSASVPSPAKSAAAAPTASAKKKWEAGF